ncbi:hypothetical protein MED121_19921 [Marinomonas sp. MED121]|nr:hypothetical protein MED121_19921 [Marinomonas sp. MED121]
MGNSFYHLNKIARILVAKLVKQQDDIHLKYM